MNLISIFFSSLFSFHIRIERLRSIMNHKRNDRVKGEEIRERDHENTKLERKRFEKSVHEYVHSVIYIYIYIYIYMCVCVCVCVSVCVCECVHIHRCNKRKNNDETGKKYNEKKN
ncbi:hypothetical protein AAMO2058_000115800 [Amorphochlora amoebiformis]